MRYCEILREYGNGDKMLVIRKALEKAGLTYVSYGSHALVMRSRDGDIVKVFEPGRCYRDFLKLISKNQNNPHFPRVRKLVRFQKGAFKGNWMLKMESLESLPQDEYDQALGFHCFVAKNITRSPFSLNGSFS